MNLKKYDIKDEIEHKKAFIFSLVVDIDNERRRKNRHDIIEAYLKEISNVFNEIDELEELNEKQLRSSD